MIQFDEEKQKEKLDILEKKNAESLAEALADRYGIPYIDLTIAPINIDAVSVIPEADARLANLAAFNLVDKNLHVGVISPTDQNTIDEIAKLSEKYRVIPYLVTKEGLARVWNRYKELSLSVESHTGSLEISNDEIADILSKVKNIEDVKKIAKETINLKKLYRVSKFFEIILAGALATKSSDIHLEPEETFVRLRYRLDGVLADILHFDHELYSLLLSRIKLISNMKINVHGVAQDGRFSIKAGEQEIEIRASILPGNYSDSVVFRVLNPNAISVPLEDLGIHPRLLEILKHETSKPNGMILTTGPTGSGKTTTLYALLKKIHTPDIKIITIENPVEYHLSGIVQTQTDSDHGYTFLAGLRAALRQDPDVIMVGEIRDDETAEIAVNAALTGHLVFSTLHTNNAAGTFPRLIDLGINPKVMTSSINLAMAQRLIRKLCVECKEKITPDEKVRKFIEETISSINDKSYLEGLQQQDMWGAKGCEKCNFTGYKGRVGVYEAIIPDETVEKVILNNPSEREIEKAAAPQNILSLKQDGVIKILHGVTSLDELARVVDLGV